MKTVKFTFRIVMRICYLGIWCWFSQYDILKSLNFFKKKWDVFKYDLNNLSPSCSSNKEIQPNQAIYQRASMYAIQLFSGGPTMSNVSPNLPPNDATSPPHRWLDCRPNSTFRFVRKMWQIPLEPMFQTFLFSLFFSFIIFLWDIEVHLSFCCRVWLVRFFFASPCII